MKNRLINKNNNIFKKNRTKQNKKTKTKTKQNKKKNKFYRIFLTAILPTKSCKDNSKKLFLHCLGLYWIVTIRSLDLQHRPTKLRRACSFFSSLHIKINGSLITKPTFGSYSFKGAAFSAGFRCILYTLYSVRKKELSVQRWLMTSCR